ncbi:MAG: flagellar biosynthesis anti-sigma factor FlgM, partial [Burkholderiaceae bacterium]
SRSAPRRYSVHIDRSGQAPRPLESTMKIGNPADKPLPPVVANGTAAANGQPQPATAIPAKADASAKIELSSTASTLLSSGTTAEFDAEKVARISQAIGDGSFKINADAIADKLISNAQELLSKTQS